MLDSLAFVLQTASALFAIDRPNALYGIIRVFFCCPLLVTANAFKRSSESVILLFGWVWDGAGSGVNKVTGDFDS